ncbi:MAG: pyruvate formate lyase family protein, partial [Bacteroidota bacterium]
MTDRINELRKQSLEATNTISAERAILVTDFYATGIDREVSVAVMRAMTLDYILSNKFICINDQELIVGERGPAPKATPTYPEINLHTIDDLEILDARKKVSFKVFEETKQVYREKIIPFWKGKSNRERIMRTMNQEWHDAYKAGIFTEFQEQRAPGHTVAGDKIYKKGMLDIIEDIHNSISSLDYSNDPFAYDKEEELKAMEIAARAIIQFANRHADKLTELAKTRYASHVTRYADLMEMARICRKVPTYAPETFHEALQ